MKQFCVFLGITLFMVLLIYGTLAYCVFFYYGPRIAEEEQRKEGWIQAISEVESECRQATDALAKKLNVLAQKKADLERSVRIQKSRISLLEKDFKGHCRFPSSLEWQRRMQERLIQAQTALNDLKNRLENYPAEKARITELSLRLAALRVRRAEVQDLYEKRDKLMVWPLPLIASFFEKQANQE